ncbi:MAG: ABC transporter ATP-binding protein [Thermodesulfobacteriota bacterium]|nr:ABC transporter ATP-binding protein [Thermodesulfobacteriota bacterium]
MLEIKKLTCGYDDKLVLKDINLMVSHTDLLGIIGPNGSGKTTLLRAITKVLKSKKGKILLEGKNILEISNKELAKKIAFVSQTSGINLNINVEEFVLLGRIPHRGPLQFLENRKDIEIIKKAMLLTDTFALKERLLSELSGGERQLVTIACALAQEPGLLILDEPTAHLDITHKVKVLNLIKKLNKENGLTVIMVLHDLNLASEYCNRLVLIKNGVIRIIGSPQEVLTCKMIEDVYKTKVMIKENPVSSKPYVLLVSSEG